MLNLGDRGEDSMIDFKWSSNDASGASVTRTVDGTISCYKGNSATQSTAGITDTEDFDSLTGIHHCRIDLSADAFYETGYDYDVVLSAATIDGQTVNAVLAHFSIEKTLVTLTELNAEMDTALSDYDAPTKAEMDAGLAALNDLSAAQVNAEVDTALSDYDGPTKAELDSGLAGLNDITAQNVVDGLMAEVLEGSKTYKQAFLDLWAVLVGNAAANDATSPTYITYDSPDDSIQRAHTHTSTTRTVA